MDWRMRFRVACRDTDEAFAAICREFGVSRQTGYKSSDTTRPASRGSSTRHVWRRSTRGGSRTVTLLRTDENL